MMLDILTTFRKVTIDGHQFWVRPLDGRVLPVVAGAADGEEGGEGEGGETKTFTQAEVDRMMGRARSEGKSSAASELAEQLGCTVDEAKDLIAKAKKDADAEKSDAQKAREAADAEKAQAAKERADAARERLTAKVERQLLRAGINPDHLDRAHRLIDVADDADDDAIKADVEALKTDLPALFEEKKTPPPGGGKPPAPGPGGKPAPTTGGTNPARDRARRRIGVPATKAS